MNELEATAEHAGLIVIEWSTEWPSNHARGKTANFSAGY